MAKEALASAALSANRMLRSMLLACTSPPSGCGKAQGTDL